MLAKVKFVIDLYDHSLIWKLNRFKIMDPEEVVLYKEPLEIGGSVVEYSTKIKKRGMHYMCFDLTGGEVL